MSLITCVDASFGYDGKEVVTDLSFNIEQGDYLCIVGNNGAGKSTLIGGLLGFRKPISGSVSMGDDLVKNQIGYLPQSSTIKTDFPASVYEVVISGTLNRNRFIPFYTKHQKEIADINMKRLRIEELKNSAFSELSGGQVQRVLLARALCASTKVLLLDEPVAGLDPVITKDFYELIKKLNEEGITIIMVSHDVHYALKNANKILHLNNKQLFFGSSDDYQNSEIGKNFLGVQNVGY